MGIDVDAFIGTSHEFFVCPFCHNVADEPIVSDCEHLFCKACFKPGRCPCCRQEIKTMQSMDRILKSNYGLLKLKCIRCDVILTLSSYKDHYTQQHGKFYDGNISTFWWGNAGMIDLSLRKHLRKVIRNKMNKLTNPSHFKRGTCGMVIGPDDYFYMCKTCTIPCEIMALCEDCFSHGNHIGHAVCRFQGDGSICDCGDFRLIKERYLGCSLHKQQ